MQILNKVINCSRGYHKFDVETMSIKILNETENFTELLLENKCFNCGAIYMQRFKLPNKKLYRRKR